MTFGHQLLAAIGLCVASISSHGTELIDEKVDTVLGLTKNLGSITRKTVEVRGDTMETIVKISADHGRVQIEFDKTGELTSVVRQSDAPDKPLRWEKKLAADSASVCVAKLTSIKMTEEPMLIAQENVNGIRSLWSVSWPRRIQNFKVADDFITVTFDESDGLFGFARVWSTPDPASVPEKPLIKSEAMKLAPSAARQVMGKFSSRFEGYRLGKIVLQDLVIVAPNNVLSEKVKTQSDLLNGDVENPRLAWIVVFRVEVDPTGKAAVIADVSGLSVWLDAETGACIGAEF